MTRRSITRERLDLMLRAWGAWEASARVGPKVGYHTMDREYARLRSGGGRQTVTPQLSDGQELAEITEMAILRLPRPQQLALVGCYARAWDLARMAREMRMGMITVEALLDAAIAGVWSELEAMV